MKKWESTFNNNHLRLMRVHIGLMIFYFIFFGLVAYFLSVLPNENSEPVGFLKNLMLIMVGYSPLFVLHLLLAIGAKKKLELSRKISEIVFAIMVLAFPIGTILSLLYFLPRTIWKSKES